MTRDAAPVRITWRTRHTPLAPSAVVVSHAARAALLRSLTLRAQEPTQLSYAESDACMIVTGPEARLPWADGVVYLGAESSAPQLLVPTRLIPCVPIALLERALRRHTGVASGALAVLPRDSKVIDVSSAHPLTREALTELLALERHSDG